MCIYVWLPWNISQVRLVFNFIGYFGTGDEAIGSYLFGLDNFACSVHHPSHGIRG